MYPDGITLKKSHVNTQNVLNFKDIPKKVTLQRSTKAVLPKQTGKCMEHINTL